MQSQSIISRAASIVFYTVAAIGAAFIVAAFVDVLAAAFFGVAF